jgi:hypothetical protein
MVNLVDFATRRRCVVAVSALGVSVGYLIDCLID